jgi:hypothetical protein
VLVVGSMYLIKTVLLRKQGVNNRENWRQLCIFVTHDTDQYVMQTYYGNKLTSLKPDWTSAEGELLMCEINLNNILKDRLNNGYEIVDLLSIQSIGLPFSDFIPPKYSALKPIEIKTLLSTDNYKAIPIPFGERIYIKIGCESITSIKCIKYDGSEIVLPEVITNGLLKTIKLGIIESIILEGYLHGHQLTLCDIACLNGLRIKQSFEKRINKLQTLFKKNNVITIASFIDANKTLIDFNSNNENIQFYLIKNNAKIFSYFDNEFKPFIIPNFFEIPVIVEKKLNENTYQVACFDQYQSVVVGQLKTNQKINVNAFIWVNCNNINSQTKTLEHCWLSNKNSITSCSNVANINQLGEAKNFWFNNQWPIPICENLTK